ncbi:MAG: synthase [Bacteroidota bacterium]
MLYQEVVDHLVTWLKSYAEENRQQGFVVGVSGGVDSALTSTLCAMTGLPTLLLELPIHQPKQQVSRAQEHMSQLQSRFGNVSGKRVDLTQAFDDLVSDWEKSDNQHIMHLTLANTRSRLRMTTLYYHAGTRSSLVAGTGNKIEDFGVGFYTKYGDGGVDISPIADLTKTEVFHLAKFVGVPESILIAPPTDGLWEDDRSDEDQMGATYPELEWAMEWLSDHGVRQNNKWIWDSAYETLTNPRQQEVLRIYMRMNNANQHKMNPIPVCIIPVEFKF